MKFVLKVVMKMMMKVVIMLDSERLRGFGD